MSAEQGHGTQPQRATTVLLNDGHKMPAIGVGTFSPDIITVELVLKNLMTVTNVQSAEFFDQAILKTTEKAVKTALDIGYRHVDSAYIYMTEKAVGQAFQETFSEGTLRREDVFYTTKLWNTFHRPELVRPALERSLASAQLDYVDLFIIHHPVSLKPGEDLFPSDERGVALYDEPDLCQTWKAMEECKDAGLARSIGVSNFNRQQLELILNKPDLKYKPVCNQVECHPYLTQNELLEFCKSNDIILVAYGVLGSPGGKGLNPSFPNLMEDPILMAIGDKYRKSPAQVCIRYLLQRGCAAVIKSFNPERMRHNFEIFDFTLSPEDMKAIDGLNKNLRNWRSTIWQNHPQYPFREEARSEETASGVS